MSDAIVRDVGYTGYSGQRAVDRTTAVLAEHTARTLWARTGVRRAIIVSFIPALVCMIQIYLEEKGTGVCPGAQLPMILLTRVYGVLFPSLIVALAAAGGTIAEDRRSHALSFYFARPLQPIQYLLGRLLGVLVVLTVAALGPPLAGALFRLALVHNASDFMSGLVVTGVTLLLGAALAIILTVFSLLAGAVTESRGAAQSFVALAFVLPWMCAGLGEKLLDGPWMSLLSVPDLLTSIGHATVRETASLFSAMLYAAGDTSKDLSLWAALPSLVALVVLPFFALRARVEKLGASGGERGDG